MARWNGRDAAGKVARDGSYRLKVQRLGPHDRAAQPARARHGVRRAGHERVAPRDLARLRLARRPRHRRRARQRAARGPAPARCARAVALVRTVRVRQRARALAVSWPPYDGRRCTTAPDGRYRPARDRPRRARQHARDRRSASSPRAASSSRCPTARSSPASACASASRPTPAACGSTSRGSAGRRRCWRARRTRPPRSRACPAALRGRRLRRRATAMRAARIDGAAGGARREPGARRAARQPGGRASVLAPYQRRLDALGIRFDAITLRDVARGRARTATRPSSCRRWREPAPSRGRPGRDEPRRHRAGARRVIPAALALAGAAGLAGVLTRGDRAARLASLAAARGGDARRCSAGSASPTPLRAHAAPAAVALVVALALGVGLARRAPAPAAGAAVRRLPRRCRSGSRCTSAARTRTCSCRCTRVIGVAWLALVLERCAAGSPCACRPAALALPLLLLVAWEGASLAWSASATEGAKALAFYALPSASCWRRSWRTRRRARACRTSCASRSRSRSIFAAVGVYQLLRHDIWWNRKLMVSNAFSSFFRVNSIFYDPSIFGRYLAVTIALVFAALLFGSVRRPLAGRRRPPRWPGSGSSRRTRSRPSSRSARPSARGSSWRSGAGSPGCCWRVRCSSASGCSPCRRCATPASTA